MGYITEYELKFDKSSLDLHKFIKDLDDLTGIYYDGEYLGDMKWYECEEDMSKISKLYPDTLFTLKGDGEDSGNNWTTYFKNGKSQNAKTTITIEPFDESKLK